MNAIPPNGKRPIRITLPYLAANADHMWDVATHPLRITIDPNGVVDEQFEQNNARLVPLSPAQLAHCAPDLTVVSARFVRNVTAGYADVTGKNEGGRPVPRFTVALVNTKAAAGREWRTTWSEGRLQSGESVTVKVIRPAMLDEREPEPGGRPRPPVPPWTDFSCLNAVVDPNNQVFTKNAGGGVAGGIAGPRSEFMVLETSRPFSVIAVHLRPGGGFPFFGVPGWELHNRNVTLDMVWGRYAATVRDRLWEAKTPEQRFRILEQALLTGAHGSLDRHPAVRYALDVFNSSNGARRVGDVVQRIGLSPRRFVEIFRSEVGCSPKSFCRIRRFNEALRRIEGLTDVDWVDVALSCGYFDQAHFNHDFRAFAGLSPSSYLRHRITRTHVAVTD